MYDIFIVAEYLAELYDIETKRRIMDIFVKLRQAIFDNTELRLEVEAIKNALTKQNKRQDSQDKNIELVFQYLDELAEKKTQPEPERRRIGYRIGS